MKFPAVIPQNAESFAPNIMSTHRILIVEDNHSLAEVLEYNLRQEGYDTLVVRDGKQGLLAVHSYTPNLVLLDLMLPLVDGIEVCRTLRITPATRDLLVLMLTARSEEADQIRGFEAGADDYVTKPFSTKILLQRIHALLRRHSTGKADSEVVVSQGIMIDLVRHRVTIGDKAVELTPSEFALLKTFVRRPGRAFSRAELIDSALGDDIIVLDRTIDVHIRALRKKMGVHAILIETVRGVGYRLRDPADAVEMGS